MSKKKAFDKKFLFRVEIDGVESAAFKSCSEIGFEAATIEHWEGGRIIPHKEPGRITVPDVTLERGQSGDVDLYNWALETANLAAGVGTVEEDLKRGLDVVQYDRAGNEKRRWRLHKAFVKKFVAGSWDNSADDFVIEQIVIVYDYPEKA